MFDRTALIKALVPTSYSSKIMNLETSLTSVINEKNSSNSADVWSINAYIDDFKKNSYPNNAAFFSSHLVFVNGEKGLEPLLRVTYLAKGVIEDVYARDSNQKGLPEFPEDLIIIRPWYNRPLCVKCKDAKDCNDNFVMDTINITLREYISLLISAYANESYSIFIDVRIKPERYASISCQECPRTKACNKYRLYDLVRAKDISRSREDYYRTRINNLFKISFDKRDIEIALAFYFGISDVSKLQDFILGLNYTDKEFDFEKYRYSFLEEGKIESSGLSIYNSSNVSAFSRESLLYGLIPTKYESEIFEFEAYRSIDCHSRYRLSGAPLFSKQTIVKLQNVSDERTCIITRKTEYTPKLFIRRKTKGISIDVVSFCPDNKLHFFSKFVDIKFFLNALTYAYAQNRDYIYI